MAKQPTRLSRGILISIEGIDGSGKSTLAHHLYTHCTEYQLPTLLTKEPGDNSIGPQIRSILQHHQQPLDPRAEFLLFAADRAQHITEVIKPALAQHKLIISDRMADSSLVYQGYGRNLSKSVITDINNWVMDGVQPDLVIFIFIDPETAFLRLQQRAQTPTRFEKEQRDFFNRIAHGFDQVAQMRENSIHIDGNQSPEEIAQETFTKLYTWIQKNNLLITT